MSEEKKTSEITAPVAKPKSDQSFWANVKKQFKKNRLAVYSLRFIYVLVAIALLADFIANEKPIIAKYNDTVYFPVFKSYAVDMGLSNWPQELQNVTWRDLNYDWVVFPPVPYLPKNIDYNNTQSKGPFDDQIISSNRYRHWMGTDELGHDILSAMIHGTRIALVVGLVSMSIASIIGIILGALAGYFGDERLRVSRIRLFLTFIAVGAAWFYGFHVRSFTISDAMANSVGGFLQELLLSILLVLGIILAGNLLAIPLKKIPFLTKKVRIPIDIIVSRMIEVMLSIPTLFLIIAIVAVIKNPSIFWVMAIIGLTSWTRIARFIRAELLRVRSLEYIEAANALGYSQFRIVVKHALPNALSSMLIAVAFGIASAILVEATLSFLGIGVPAETLTWGSLLSAARQTPTAWWLATFPGFAIFITVVVYNLVGEGLTDALDPRLKK